MGYNQTNVYFSLTFGFQEEEELAENEIMLRVKIAGPEILFGSLLPFVNIVCGVIVFTVLMETSPEYARTMAKIEKASGFSMSLMINLVCPIAMPLSGLVKITYLATSERWKEIGSSKKWTSKQFVPKPKSKIVLEKVTFQEAPTAPKDLTAEFSEILETIHGKKK